MIFLRPRVTDPDPPDVVSSMTDAEAGPCPQRRPQKCFPNSCRMTMIKRRSPQTGAEG